MEDSERAKNLVFKFLVLFYINVFLIQPDFLTWNVATAFYFFTVGFFL